MSTQEYIDAYLKTITTPSHNTKKLFAIGMVGLNGVGKSTFANALANELNLYVASNDQIRRWLNEQGFAGESPEQDLVQAIAEASSVFLYKQQISHIIDNDLVKFYKNAKNNANENGAEFYLLHLEAPEEVVLQRLEQRQQDIDSGTTNNLSRVGADEYFKRKQLHEELGQPEDLLLTINTFDDTMKGVNQVVESLKNKNAI